MKKFEKTIDVRWSDCDPNMHVRHSIYYDYGGHARIRFFVEHGFGPKEMSQLNIGPILFKEECSFIKEIKTDDVITVNILQEKVSEDGSRWVLHHEIFNKKGEKSAHITVKGAWIDLSLRKLAVPPPQLAKIFHELPFGEEYSYQKTKK